MNPLTEDFMKPLLGKIVPAIAVVLVLVFTPKASAQDAGDDPAPANGASATVIDESQTMQLVEVDWIEELVQGGVTMIGLGLLSVALLAFTVERLINLRSNRFVPTGFSRRVRSLSEQGDDEVVLEASRKHPSTLGRVVAYWVTHRELDRRELSEGAADLAARDLADAEQRLAPFAVIAALAPLLGLLGTMIGMIEAFKLVEVFGDEGGASMLAGSISKALITTAVGLILAIPALAVYHWMKHRLHNITKSLEVEIETLHDLLFLGPKKPVDDANQTDDRERPAKLASKASKRTRDQRNDRSQPAKPVAGGEA